MSNEITLTSHPATLQVGQKKKYLELEMRFRKELRHTPACVTERWMEPLKPPEILNQLGTDAPLAGISHISAI